MQDYISINKLDSPISLGNTCAPLVLSSCAQSGIIRVMKSGHSDTVQRRMKAGKFNNSRGYRTSSSSRLIPVGLVCPKPGTYLPTKHRYPVSYVNELDIACNNKRNCQVLTPQNSRNHVKLGQDNEDSVTPPFAGEIPLGFVSLYDQSQCLYGMIFRCIVPRRNSCFCGNFVIFSGYILA